MPIHAQLCRWRRAASGGNDDGAAHPVDVILRNTSRAWCTGDIGDNGRFARQRIQQADFRHSASGNHYLHPFARRLPARWCAHGVKDRR